MARDARLIIDFAAASGHVWVMSAYFPFTGR
jgi:hypothetical protein